MVLHLLPKQSHIGLFLKPFHLKSTDISAMVCQYYQSSDVTTIFNRATLRQDLPCGLSYVAYATLAEQPHKS